MIATMPERFRPALLLGLAACGFHPDYRGTHYQCDNGVCPSGFTCIAGFCESATADAGPGMDADASMLPWWDPAFTHRARITITNNSRGALPVGFQIGVYVDLKALAGAPASWNEVRIVRWDGAQWTEKNRYLEGLGSDGTLWFRLDSEIAPNDIGTEDWLYFTNPGAGGAPSSGSAVFDFYDSFSGTTVNTTNWTIQGTPAQANSDLVLHPNDSVRSNMQWPPGYAVTSALGAANNIPRFWIGYQRQTDFTDGDPWIIWINRAPTDTDAPPGAVDGTIWGETNIIAVSNTIDYGMAKPLDGNKHYYTVQRLDDRIVFKYDQHEEVVRDYMLPASFTMPLQIRLANEGTGNINYGMVIVHQAVWPDPTVAIGPTEMQ